MTDLRPAEPKAMVEIVKAWESSNISRTLLVSIPKSIKEKLNLGKGSRFIVRVERGRIIFKPFKLEEAVA